MAFKIDKLKGSLPYQIRLTNLGDSESTGPGAASGITVFTTEPISFNLTSNWQEVSNSANINTPLQGVAQAITGYSAVSPWASFQVWTGTAPLEFTVTGSYVAASNSKIEVIDPALMLAKWTLPSNDDGDPFFFKPPIEPTQPGIILQSNWYIIPELVIVNVAFNPAHSYAYDGYPVRADIVISLRTRRSITAKEFIDYFSEGSTTSKTEFNRTAAEAAEAARADSTTSNVLRTLENLGPGGG